jgi:glycine/D-amino acid oxidase-like deaminating enzyme
VPPPWPSTPPTAVHRAAYAEAAPRSFWLDDVPAREPHPPLEGATRAALCIVGGGYTGLWAALHALADDPSRDVVVLEATRCGDGASGRNGGFVSSSLTHGQGNGIVRFPDELDLLERLGDENFEGMLADIERHGIDAQVSRGGDLMVALEPHQLEDLGEELELLERFGHDFELLDAQQTRARVDSPTYLGALLDRTGSALVHPGRLADGLRAAAVRAGARIHEHTPATALERAADGSGITVRTTSGSVHADRVLLAQSAYRSLLRSVRLFVAPVYDYALMTEPLSAAQRDAIGWRGNEGVSDMANRFHYYRMSADGRILFGGYDAVYRFGGPVGPAQDDHDATFAVLSQHFFTTFPQLEGLRFTHRWGGAIDTCSRFSAFFGTAHGGRVAYATGYTGLGVGASRFGARVALDLLDGRSTAATRSAYVRRKPVPFPPEPLRAGVIALTRNRLAAADEAQGRRGLWLRTLDRLGLGFDS